MTADRGVLRWIVGVHLRHPRVVVLVCAVLSAVCLWRASHLTVVTDFSDLLPSDQPSVVEMRRIVDRSRGLSNVFVVLEGAHAPKLTSLADKLVPSLVALGRPAVDTATSGVHAARRFLMPRAGLFLSDERQFFALL
ncbi:MAG: hypothetical protein H7X95_14455 [Deltaproteobacteria bacterium]|nr:hypothetical protein [Deltaproteobacteria bacterium]